MTGTIRGLLFDKDGTLVDAFGGWVELNHRLFDEYRLRYGFQATREDLDRLLGMEGEKAVPGGLLASGTEEQIYRAHHRLLGDAAPDWETFFPEIRHRSRQLFAESPPGVKPLGRVGETLRLLRTAGYRLGIATSDSEANAVRDLADQGGDLVEFWATADKLDHPKPHPESVLRFARFTGLPLKAIAFVGDSEVDLAAARSAGVGLFVAVKSATCPPEVIAAADAAVDTVDELPQLLNRLRPPATPSVSETTGP